MAWHNKPNPAKTPQVSVPKAPTPKPATKPTAAKPVAAKPAAKPATPTTGHHHTHHTAVHKKAVVHPHKPPHHKVHQSHLSMPKADVKPVQATTTHKVVTTKQVTPDIITASKVKPPKRK